MSTTVEDYEAAVEPATTAFRALYREVLDDVDEVNSGITWWYGYTDWRRLTLISEYLLNSIIGVSRSLAEASLCAKLHREQLFADNNWLNSRWRAVGEASPRPAPSDFIRAATTRNGHERSRERQVLMTAEHCFYHLAQALDRVAAGVVAVAAFKRTNLIEVDWGSLDSPRNAVRDRQQSKFLEPLGAPGRELQDRLLKAADNTAAHGPVDWLPWLIRARNSATHRPPKMQLDFLTGDRRSSIGMLHPFYRQPGWTDTETLVAGGGGHGPAGMYIMKQTTQILDGLVGSVTGLTESLGKVMLEVWRTRRDDPRLLVQPGEQWPTVLGQPTLDFPGYGPDAPIHENGMAHVSPDSAKRLKASRVMDAARGQWHSEG
jgi:hypothetical protein